VRRYLHVSWRKGAKPRFDYHLFAKKQNIDLDWLFEGDLRAYPRSRLTTVPHCSHPSADGGDAA
jgi:hypothetical protein